MTNFWLSGAGGGFEENLQMRTAVVDWSVERSDLGPGGESPRRLRCHEMHCLEVAWTEVRFYCYSLS